MTSRSLRLIFAIISCSFFQVQLATGQDFQAITESVIASLQKNNFGHIHNNLDKHAKAVITKKQLKAVWMSITESYGVVESHSKIELDTSNGSHTTLTELMLEKNSLILMLSFDDALKIRTFQFLPQTYSMPDAAKNIVLGKKLLTVQTDTFQLSGELIFPLHVANPPVIVLVQGSGGSDLDESIGPNKIFKDLALELAMQGIATFRYDKRSFVYKSDFAQGIDFTLANETTDDAINALKMMKFQTEIDTDRIFVLGHSLGAYAAPKIAAEVQNVSGIIMLAGPYNPVYELIPMQFRYIFGLDNKKKAAKKRLIQKADKQTELLRTRDYETLKKEKSVIGYWPIVFWQNLEAYNPATYIDSLQIPSLILQGKRDYQVTFDKEYKTFELLLSSKDHVTLEAFDGLNHLFLYGDNPSVPSEYMKPGHIDPRVINSIANWISTH